VKSRKIASKFLFWINWLAGFFLMLSILAPLVKPSWSALISMIGLAYPIILFWELLCILLFLLLRSKRVWEPLVLISLSWFSLSTFYSFGSNERPIQVDGLVKVASWNTRFFDASYENVNENLDRESYKFIKSIQADIMGFQEYRSRNEIDLEKAFRYVVERENLAFGSNFPISGHGYVKFERDISYGGNAFQWIDVKINNKNYRIYNCHLSSIRLSRSELNLVDNPSDVKDQEELKGRSKKLYKLLKQGFVFRQKQQEVLLEHMAQSPFPVLLIGDVNDTPYSYISKEFRSIFKDSWMESGKGIGKTYIHRFLPYKIDYIYLPRDLLSYRSQTHKHDRLSDHYAISSLVAFED